MLEQEVEHLAPLEHVPHAPAALLGRQGAELLGDAAARFEQPRDLLPDLGVLDGQRLLARDGVEQELP